MANKKHKLDIFKTLSHISTKDRNFYSDLTEEERKAFQPRVVMRWLSGTNDARQLYFLNELVNPFVFSLYKHPQLLYNLMTICTSGRSQRYFWNKSLSKKTSTTPEVIKVIKDYLHYSTLHAIESLPLLSNETILEYAEQLGRQKEDISKIKRELKTRK